MNRTLIILAFTASFLFTMVAAWFKIIHASYADTLLGIGLLFSYACVGVVLYWIFSSKKMTARIKMSWMLGVFLIGWPLAIIYVLIKPERA